MKRFELHKSAQNKSYAHDLNLKKQGLHYKQVKNEH